MQAANGAKGGRKHGRIENQITSRALDLMAILCRDYFSLSISNSFFSF
jgi:hypothetical protein